MSQEKSKPAFMAKVVKILLPMMLIAAGGAAWSYFKVTAPVMKRVAPQRQVSVVDVQTVRRVDARVVISAMGTVVAAREVTLKAQVAGSVASVFADFLPGGRIAKGQELLRLDPSDYTINVKKAQSALEDARAALAIEQGNQNIAREELRLLTDLAAGEVAQTDLALRKPQLRQARAAVESAEADLRQAMLDLDRTMVRAPFNAMIVTRSVNVGAYVGAQESLATLVGTDQFWIETAVPLDRLALIDLDHAGGCPVVIRSQAGNGSWQGRVIRVAGKLNASSRMATVIVAVDHPLGTAEKPVTSHLMIDDYVYADITGRVLTDVIELPRAALQDGDTVWVDKNDALDIRKVTLAWKSVDKIYLHSGVTPGEQVVISALSTPVQGMLLKRAADPSKSLADGATEKGGDS